METKMKNNLPLMAAKTVSVLFHPIFMVLYGLLVIFTAPTVFWYIPVTKKAILFSIFFVSNVFVPVFLILLFRYRRHDNPVYPEERGERTFPLMTVSLLYAFTSFILSRLQLPVFFKAYAYSLTMLSLTLLTVNRWWKISLHSAGAGALISVVLILSIRMSSSLPFYVAGSVIISGLILSSRLKLNSHNPSEVYAGFFAGFLIPTGIMLLFQ